MAFDQNNIDDLLKEAGLGDGEGGADTGDAGADAAAGDVGAPGQAAADDILSAAAGGEAQPVTLPSLDASAAGGAGSEGLQSLLGDVELKVQVVLGSAKMSVEQILALADGSVVELNKLAGDPLDILVNDRLVAKGEVLVLNENFCIRLTDIVPPDDRS